MSASKEAHMGHLAAKDWEERVTKEDPRARNGWQSLGMIIWLRMLVRKHTTRIANMAIRGYPPTRTVTRLV